MVIIKTYNEKKVEYDFVRQFIFYRLQHLYLPVYQIKLYVRNN